MSAQIAGTSTYAGGAAASHNVTIPAEAQTNNRVFVAAVARDTGTVISWPSGWTVLEEFDYNPGGNGIVVSIGYRDLDGTEGFNFDGNDTITFGLSASKRFSAIVSAIGQFDPNSVPEFARSQAWFTAVDSATLAPSWGSEENLWLTYLAYDGGSALTVTQSPTNGYDNLLSAASDLLGLAQKSKQATAASDTPDPRWEISAGQELVMYVVAVRSVAGDVHQRSVGSLLAGSLVDA